MNENKRSSSRVLQFFAVGVVLIVSCFSVAPVVAQVLYGSVVGVVRDPQGAGVPGAIVEIVNKNTNLTRETVTSSDGSYSLVNVVPGPYDVKVSLTGFRAGLRSSVPVTVGQIARVDVILEVGSISETVTVASSIQLLQTDKSDVHTELKSKEIINLPLNQYRNYQTLINLVPGATPAAFQNDQTDTPGRSLRTFVNGTNPNTQQHASRRSEQREHLAAASRRAMSHRLRPSTRSTSAPTTSTPGRGWRAARRSRW